MHWGVNVTFDFLNVFFGLVMWILSVLIAHSLLFFLSNAHCSSLRHDRIPLLTTNLLIDVLHLNSLFSFYCLLSYEVHLALAIDGDVVSFLQPFLPAVHSSVIVAYGSEIGPAVLCPKGAYEGIA